MRDIRDRNPPRSTRERAASMEIPTSALTGLPRWHAYLTEISNPTTRPGHPCVLQTCPKCIERWERDGIVPAPPGQLPTSAVPRGADFGAMRQPGFGRTGDPNSMVEVNHREPCTDGCGCRFCDPASADYMPTPDLSTKAGMNAYVAARMKERSGR